MTDWETDCGRYVGHVLTGVFAHWCPDWDFMPVDETQPEFECCTCRFMDACRECMAKRATEEDMTRAHDKTLPDEVQPWEAALCWAHTPDGPHAKPAAGPPPAPSGSTR